ncbi:hypothetical protein EYB45_07445 [Erythrobacteraceae bacterium CFH 75059]|uniref:hypothetical protein n=1 Tax=Qipengyuania thermophila TaxID=2509361 RepID=UPI00102110AA|nr:hypothetical protein [Qipengyuania thermophila]TCD05306.1 hypothetical protein EYB45_07445 [Erythrobacteraceae bacterium CFH 75059]
MKRTALACMTLALAACGQNNRTAQEQQAQPTTPATGAMAPAAPSASAGVYEVTTTDNQRLTKRLNADGSYLISRDGTQTESGRWRESGQQLCLTPQGGSETCYTGSQPDASGAFVMQGSGGALNGASVRRTAG